MTRRRVAFVTTGIRSLSGGIAAVNENILIALGELVRSGRIALEVDSLLEEDADRPSDLPPSAAFRGFRGSKRNLALRTVAHAARGRLLLYERVGLALATAPLAAAGVLKSVVFAHGSDNWRNLKQLDVLALRGADLVMTNSSYTLRRMQAYPPLTDRFRAVVCELGLSPAFALHDSPPADDGTVLELRSIDGAVRALGARVLLLVGRMDSTEREKGHDHLIAALPTVRRRFPDVQLVCAGGGDDRFRLEALAGEAGVAGAVFFPGHVSKELLDRLYRRCYAFTMPSRQEGFGLVYLEAMNYAKPCLGCWEDGAEDVIVDGRTGCLIRDPFDTPALAEALCRLLEDPAGCFRMGREGFERLHRRFAPQQFRARFLESFSQVIQ